MLRLLSALGVLLTVLAVASLEAQTRLRLRQHAITVGAGTITAGPHASITCPMGAVELPVGSTTSGRQITINANGAGTTYCLAAGTHTASGPNTPKTGDIYIGEFGAIIDGTGWTSADLDDAVFKALNQDIDNVTIRNLVIRNVPQKAVMAWRDFSSGWTVEYSEIYNCKTGVDLPSGSTVTHSKIHDCVGTPGHVNPAERGGAYAFNTATGATFTYNELYNNGTEQKFILSTSVNCSWNYFHDNDYAGCWLDGGGSGSIVANNTCDDNGGPGIYIEIADSVAVHHNSCSRNGEGGILLSVSQGIDVHSNVLTDNAFGFDLFLDCSRLSESYPPHPSPDLTDNNIHDNTVVVGAGQKAVVFTHIGGCEAAYVANTKQNNFDRNAYTVPGGAGAFWTWGNGVNKTWAEWQAIPQDANGSVQ